MTRASKLLVLIGVIWLGMGICAAQLTSEPADAQKAAVAEAAADQFIQQLHSSLDVGSLTAMFASDTAARYREYPGDFMPFDTPRVSKVLLKQTDDATLNRKLVADWNLHYLQSLVMLSSPASPKEPLKPLPTEFLKLARKSKLCRAFAGEGGPVTLASSDEMQQYLNESGQLIAVLRKYVKPEMLDSMYYRAAADKTRTQFGAPRQVTDALGYDKVYTVGRESVMLVMADSGGQMKLVMLAPLPF